jgi:hypothetical protein
MPLPSIEHACPGCRANLHYEESIPHPHRQGYDIHTYRCLDCGPMVYVTQLAGDDLWSPKYAVTGEQSAC